MAITFIAIPKKQQGFTLVEAVLVIVITGIIAASVASFIRVPVQGYADTAARAALTDVADIALRRMTRDIRRALPNSVRRHQIGSETFVEFLLTKTGGRYLALEDNPTSGSMLDFDDATNKTFSVLGGMPTGAEAIVAGDRIVVYNLGQGFAPADAYQGGNVGVVAATNAATTTITLMSNPFALQDPQMRSPGHRFQVVTTPVTYGCNTATGTLTRYWGYSIQAAQPNNPASGALAGAQKALLATGVTGCAFSYDNLANNPTYQRSALLGVELRLQAPGTNGESVTLFHQIHVDNTP